ncbi:MAG TPA: Mut7-C RNAse domain-containing protein, partial [Spirochaetia bacterium]|nr:Mut7-C RNAse domain-containing protein [Spirochaetia bacterium]
VRASQPRDQLLEVFRRFDCAGQVRMFTRCIECNLPLTRVDAETVSSRVPPVVAATYCEFSECLACGRVFWQGSHWERMKKLAAEVLDADPGSRDSR